MNDKEYLAHLMSSAKANGALSGREAADMMRAEGYLVLGVDGKYRLTERGRKAVDDAHSGESKP